MVTCLLYLNNVEDGGGTFFSILGMEIGAKKVGGGVKFHNYHEGSTARHLGSLHGGMLGLKGEKWAFNFWFRELMYQAPGAFPTEPVGTALPPKIH